MRTSSGIAAYCGAKLGGFGFFNRLFDYFDIEPSKAFHLFSLLGGSLNRIPLQDNSSRPVARVNDVPHEGARMDL